MIVNVCIFSLIMSAWKVGGTSSSFLYSVRSRECRHCRTNGLKHVLGREAFGSRWPSRAAALLWKAQRPWPAGAERAPPALQALHPSRRLQPVGCCRPWRSVQHFIHFAPADVHTELQSTWKEAGDMGTLDSTDQHGLEAGAWSWPPRPLRDWAAPRAGWVQAPSASPLRPASLPPLAQGRSRGATLPCGSTFAVTSPPSLRA